MFYCGDCQKANLYPETLFRSYGTCEICGYADLCFEAHHDIINVIDLQKILRMTGGM